MTALDPVLALDLKISLLALGVRISPEAEHALTLGHTRPLSVHEYATTGGVTIRIGDLYANAPFDNGFGGNDAEADLEYEELGGYLLKYRQYRLPVEVLPLPGYLDAHDHLGRRVTDTTFSHADRIRISPIGGCSYSCKFCDLAGVRYRKRDADQLLAALRIAQADPLLPPRHILISGGTPSPKDYPYFDDIAATIAEQAGMPVDVMMPPRPDTDFFPRLKQAGVEGFAINLEVYDDELGRTITREKFRLGKDLFASTIERAVESSGGAGRVRSLILVGLEPEEQTLRGVEFLASLGCDPVLSPFRPTPETPLADAPKPGPEMLKRVFSESIKIVERHRLKLGPRCIPCQHNTLTLPDNSGCYSYS